MKHLIYLPLTLLLLCGVTFTGSAQLLTESFETDGEGTRYTSNPFQAGCDFFLRDDNTVGCLTNNPTGLNGSFYWTGEDTDSNPDATGTGILTLNPLTVTGFALDVDVLLGLGRPNDFRFEPADELLFQYNMDGGGWITFAAFYGTNDATGAWSTGNLLQDIDLNGAYNIGAPEINSSAMQNFNFTIPATGNSMQVRFVMGQDAGTEEVIIDYIRINGTPVALCTDPDVPSAITATPASVCTGNTSTLAWTGALNDATLWHIYTGSCGGTQIGTSVANSFTTAALTGSTTFYISGEDGAGCVDETTGLCGTVTVTVNPLDNASFNYGAAAYCSNAADPTPTITGLAGGTFSSSPAGLSINAGTGIIDVSTSTPGTYTVTYTTAGTCPNASNVSVTINALDNAGFNYGAASYCTNALDPTPTITGLAGGTFSSTAGLAFNTGTGLIDLSASTPGTYTLTYTTAGTCPNSSNVSVTIGDAVPPVITCPGNQTETPDASCNFTLPDYTGLVTSTDNCTVSPVVTQSPVPGSVISGTTTITMTSNDGNGNTSSCTFDVILNDATAPTAVCQNITVFLDGTGNATIVAADIDGGTTDNCSGLTLSASQTAFTCADLGPNNVTLTATDGNTNSSNCIAVVTIVDTISPVVTCPGNQTETPDAFCSFALPDYTGLVTSTDNCTASPVVTQSPVPGSVISGTTAITMTSNDGNGNTSSCTFDVILNDATPPTAVCQNITVFVDGTGNASIVAADIDGGSIDNCSGLTLSASQTAFTCANLGPNNVTLTATDGNSNSSNCIAVVTVVDTISPMVTCPGNQMEVSSANCDFTLPDYTGLTVATDNCSGLPTITQSPVAGTVISGTTTVTMTGDDGNGNTSTCSFDVNLNDVTSPTAICQNSDVYLDATGTASILESDIDGGSIDNCSSVTLSASQTTFDCSSLGANNVDLTVTDLSGNSASCTAIVTVIDTIVPTASNPTALNVECIGDATIDISVVTDAMDYCSAIVTWVSDVQTGNGCQDTIVRTYNVADASGNNIDVVQMIYIEDVTPPTASNPGIITVQCMTNFPTPHIAVVTDEADNCGTPTVTFISDVSDGLSCPETFTRTYRVTDDCGNFTDVQQLVLVHDVLAPVVDAASLPMETFSCTALPTAPTATDNCAGTIIGVSDLAMPITNFGLTTITWTYTDDCGNETTQTQDVTITPMDVSTNISADGITIYATNGGATSYQWIDCGTNQPITGETGVSFTPTYNGSFAVEITDGNCFDVSPCETITTVGLNENNLVTELVEVYPNPTNGSITITSGISFNRVEVMNALGQKVGVYEMSESSHYSLTLPEENGVYLVKIYGNQSSITKRVIKR